MNKHTPGPWSAERKHGEWDEGVGVRYIDGPKHAEICVLYGAHRREAYANAQLIAAAPDLLEALQRIADPEFRYSSDDDEDTQLSLRIADARAAIARVR